MPSAAVHHPRAATCEDVDEETQAVLPGSRTSANVARKRSQSDLVSDSTTHKKSQNGSDSGYSSKAGTNDSIGCDRRKPATLSVHTNVMERHPQPYTYTPAKSTPSSQPSLKVKSTKEKASKKDERFRHPPGICGVCDHLGYHVVPPERPATAGSAPESPKSIRKSTKKADESARPKTRRQSSVRQERPASVYYLPSQPVLYNAPVFTEYGPSVAYTYGVQTPITPSPMTTPYGYYQPGALVAPSHPEWPNCCDTHGGYPATPQYLEAPPGMLLTYGEQPPMHPVQNQLHHELERVPSYGLRPGPTSQKSSRSLEADARAMPPPPRPGLRRSSNDPSQLVMRRPSVHYEDDARHIVAMKRASREFAIHDHPPTAWKGTHSAESVERPRNRKSASYSDASDASSTAYREVLPRRSTEPLEERTAQVEDYQARVSRGGAGALTAEALKKVPRQHSLSSDVGTTRSIQSSSKDSARIKRSSTVVSGSGRTNITIDGGIQLSIPQEAADQEFNLQFGKLTLTLNKDKENASLQSKEQKRLERAPSNASRGSRRSISGAGAAEEGSLSRETSRKSTQQERVKPSPNSSKRSSRAPSLSRTGHRQSIPVFDYDHPEAYYGA